MDHPLVNLSDLFDWSEFEESWSGLFPSKRSRPSTSTQLIASLLYFQHMQSLSFKRDAKKARRPLTSPYLTP